MDNAKKPESCPHNRLLHLGGGTALFPKNKKYPSDDSYRCSRCKREFSFDCTIKAHFEMPNSGSLKNFRRRTGVRLSIERYK